MWRRDWYKVQYIATQECQFFDTYDITRNIYLGLQIMLTPIDIVPGCGSINHLLWTLVFMKIYLKYNTISMICGGVDHKTSDCP